ncbi:TPA: restriction endonuclease subunit S, partial [Pasteurella multocida]|nr:restriction endonuclease subunit S [Pasteurella multocida]HDR1196106.1 restriction endonuclease subunit S [Pasteurella multocida]HDR1563629.1 restriction endonuclease subunit S [Pasteurella multocida]HDR1613435.1 restriction endonuclease subunit S [Pasteurella multocida]
HTGVANIVDDLNVLPNIKGEYAETLQFGDIIVADASEDYLGVAFPCVINCLLSKKVVAGLHTIAMRPTKSYHLFLYYLLHTQNFKEYCKKVGTGTKVFAINAKNLLAFENFIPSEQEQQKIGTFFTALDRLITTHQRKLENVKKLKKSLLQKMFPKNGKEFPEIRFPEFTDAWEQRKSKDIFINVSEKGFSDLPVLSASQEFGMVKREEIGIDIKYDRKSTNTYKRVKVGQFVIHLRSFQGGFAWSDLEGITSPAYTIIDFKNKENHHPDFWKIIFSSSNFIKKLETVTYGVRDGRSISFSDFSNLLLTFSKIQEQQKIGTFFTALDRLIITHQRKLENVKKLKKALLQQMFV